MQGSSNPVAPVSVRYARVARLMQAWADSVRFMQRTLGPVADLVVRLALAQAFVVSGLIKAANWDTALLLATNEYPVSWLSPVTAAWLGVSIELGAGVLFAVGLATRAAAAALLALSVVIQVAYREVDTNLFWAALFLWYAVRGAGALSLDHAIARGLASAPLPLLPQVIRWTAAAGAGLTPLLQLALRGWLGITLLGSVVAPQVLPAVWLPLSSAQVFPGSLAAGAGLALLCGLGARIAAACLIAALLAAQMVDAQSADSMYWLFALALLVLHGAGRWSLDRVIERALQRVFPQLEGKPAFALEGLPRVVIVGAGFGGLACAAGLRTTPVRVTVVDRNNYHLFQPLLYQVATAGLSPGDIATPVRELLRDQFNAEVVFGEVTGVDAARREVLVGATRIPYDYLVIATGASHSYFGRDQWAPHAPGLKRVEDATAVRARLLTAFEKAEATRDADERDALLTFLIVGGGPTGVELAGAIAELARLGMEKQFRHFDPAQARVVLVQAGPRILPALPEALSLEAQRALQRLGVEVLVGSRVEGIDGEGAIVNGRRIAARTVLWAAGVVASPAARWLGTAADGAGRIAVGPDLSVPGAPEIFAIGDTAASNAWNGQPVPGLAPAAKQGGAYAAAVIRARALGAPAPAPFRYRHLGSLATIGRKSAVADFGFVRLKGAAAWWLWGLVHVGFLVGLRNRISVLLDWFWSYLTYRSGTRLITGAQGGTTGAQPLPQPVQAERAAA
jgi:NADH dehydrogenase/putative oxidoreductase